MIPEQRHGTAAGGRMRSWAGVLALVLGVALLRVLYIAFLSPYALVEDEAYYWEWSRHLDWSYFSKGPGVAYAIAASTAILGDTELGVRLPAILACSLAAACAAGLAMDATGERRAGIFAAACFLAAPFMLGAGMIMTIDMPYVACWAVACWAGWHAVERRRLGAWLVVGAAVGVGFLFKYTALLLVPGILLYALRRRRLGPPLGVLAASILVALSTVPVLVWNAQRGWPTVHHLLDHLGLDASPAAPSHSEPFSPLWPLTYVLVQFAIAGPALLLTTGVIRRWWTTPDRRERPGVLYLLCCAAPIFAFYFVVSFFTEGEANWAVAGHVTLLAMAGYGAAEAVRQRRHRQTEAEAPPFRVPPTWWHIWNATVGVGIGGAVLLARPDWLASLPLVGDLVPLGRIMGGPGVARDVDRARREIVAATGQEPFIVTAHYGIASLVAFYIDDHPAVYCATSVLPGAGRPTQYDFWEDTDLHDLDRLGGRTALIIGKPDQGWAEAFTRVGEPVRMEHEFEDDRFLMIGDDYTGFDARNDR